MGKHRKRGHFRRIVIIAVGVGTVGLPSVALACPDWQDSGGHQSYQAENIAAKDWWKGTAQDRLRHGHRSHGWNGTEHSGPGAAASKTPTAAPSTPKSAAPQPRTTAPSSTAKNTAPEPSSPAPTSTPKTAASATPAPPSAPKATASASGITARIVQLVNAERGKVGCSPVTLNAVLTKAAQAHSEDMAAHRNMSHTGSDGSSPGDRITRAGYSWSTYGENVAYGYATPEQVMAGWMSSPGHKANILNCGFKEIGIGLAGPGNYWTQNFGTPA